MTAPRPDSTSNIDPLLADLVERITARLEAGEAVDPEDYRALCPERAEEIVALVASLLALGGGTRAPGRPGDGAPFHGGLLPYQLGDYRLLREVGRGGMGLVFEAEQVSLSRRVAVKVLPQAAMLDQRAFQRFQLEAQAAALLSHNNIVPVYSVGLAENVPFYVMQFIDGSNLAEVVHELARVEEAGPSEPAEEPAQPPEPGSGTGPASAPTLALSLLTGRYAPTRRRDSGSGPRPDDPSASGERLGVPLNRLRTSRGYVRTIAWLGVQAARALQHAHEQGVIHRDIKPANLMFDVDGHLWVTDFGLAIVPLGSAHTRSGDAPGTLRYMSPEQAAGGPTPIDHRTDLYSLAVTLYELLSLRPAVPGQHRGELLRRLTQEEPAPLRGLNPAVPTDFATIIGKAMAKDPAGRYASAAEMADDLERFLDGRPIAARPLGPVARFGRWCRSNPLTASLVAGLGLALVSGLAISAWGWSEAVHQRDLLRSTTHQLGRERDQKERERAAAQAALGLAESLWAESEQALAQAHAERQSATKAEARSRRSAAIAAAMNNFLVEKILFQSHPETNPVSRKITMIEVLERASNAVGTSFRNEPEIEATLRMTLSSTYHALGDYPKAEQHVREAYRLFLAVQPSDPDPVNRTRVELAHMLEHLGRLPEARGHLEATYQETSGKTARPDRYSHACATLFLGDISEQTRDYPAAERYYREYLALARSADVGGSSMLAIGLGRLARALHQLRRFDQALEVYQECLALTHQTAGPLSVAALAIENNIGTLYQTQHRYGRAAELFRRILPACTARLGEDHTATLSVTFNIGYVLLMLGDIEEAESYLHEALSTRIRAGIREPGAILSNRLILAEALRELGRFQESRETVAEALRVHFPRGGPAGSIVDKLRGYLNQPPDLPEPVPGQPAGGAHD